MPSAVTRIERVIMCEYKVVKIRYDKQTRAIICHGQNGPCPLIAILNYLILKLDVPIEPTWEQIIPEEDLLQIIQQQLKEELSGVLPCLTKQTYLNPYVNSVDGFGKAPVLEVINALRIPILHGCILDDKDSKAATALHGCSYKDLSDLDATPLLSEDESDGDRERWELIKEFMKKTKNGLNSHGISGIHDHMILQDQKLAILYRNGEFELMILHNGVIHVLQTKTGDDDNTEEEEAKPHVWQTLCDVDTDGFFVNGDFRCVNDKDWDAIIQLYIAGKKHSELLPKLKAKEDFDQQVADSERHAAELLNIIEREKLEKEEKASIKANRKAAARGKKENPQGGSTLGVVSSDEEISVTPTPSSQADDSSRALSPKELEKEEKASIKADRKAAAREKKENPQGGGTLGVVSPDEEISVPPTPSSQADDTSRALSPKEIPVPPTPSSQSLASQKFQKFLEEFNYYGRSQKPYFEGEVKLMKERNLFEISIDYSHILHDYKDLALLIRDEYDSIREDLKDCIVQYLIAQGVEKEKADQAILKILEVPKRHQSFINFAGENQDRLVEYHEIYNMVLSKCTSALGRRMARGFLKLIQETHRKGYCWNGRWTASHMEVRDGKIFIITETAWCNVSKGGVIADLKNFCDIIFPYYAHEVEETDPSGQKITEKILPIYFLEFQNDCAEVPNPVSELKAWHKFQRFLGSHPAFMAPLATSTLICHLFTVFDSLLEKYVFVYMPLQDGKSREYDWIKVVKQLPMPFTKILFHFGYNYYSKGYWFLLKYLRNFVEHMLRYTKATKDQPNVLDLLASSLMIGHYLAVSVSKLLLFIVMTFDIDSRSATAWAHFEKSE